MIIYKITNKITGLCYIGQTRRSVQQRWKEHLRSCHPNYNGARNVNIRLANAIRTYGEHNFEIEEIVSAFSIENLNALEIKFIDELNTLSPSGYNLTSGGRATIMSQETKQKMSQAAAGKPKPWAEGRLPWNKGLKYDGFYSRSILCIETNEVFTKIKLAAKKLNVNYSKIVDVCRGRRKSTGGLTFKYITEVSRA